MNHTRLTVVLMLRKYVSNPRNSIRHIPLILSIECSLKFGV